MNWCGKLQNCKAITVSNEICYKQTCCDPRDHTIMFDHRRKIISMHGQLQLKKQKMSKYKTKEYKTEDIAKLFKTILG